MHTTSRRGFIAAGSVSIAGGMAYAGGFGQIRNDGVRADPPVRADAERVQAFVGACHARIETVREMLAEDPDLAKSAWDWGFGDYETAIGACSHTGRKDIIELLLKHGARPTIFTLAALDKHAAVRGFIESMPGAREIEGPHSISLYRHAQAGEATRVMRYLERAGLDQGAEIFETDRGSVEAHVGVYGSGEFDHRIEIGWSERFSCLMMKVGEESARSLIPLGALGVGGATSETDLSIYSFRPAGSRGAMVSLSGRRTLTIEYAGNRHVAELIDQ